MQEMQEIRVWSMDWEDPLEKEMATPSRKYCLENSIDREAWRLQSTGSPGVGHDWAHMHAWTSLISHSASVTLAFFLAYCRSVLTHTTGPLLWLSSSVWNALPTDIPLVIPHLLQVSVNLTVLKRPTLPFSPIHWLSPQRTIPVQFSNFISTHCCCSCCCYETNYRCK